MATPVLSFPNDLARSVARHWHTWISGEYTAPPVPSAKDLQRICETAYLAGLETDEGRAVTFSLCCVPPSVPAVSKPPQRPMEVVEFSAPRSFTVQELRRIASAGDADAVAILIAFSPTEPKLTVRGLVNLGRSWSVARSGFTYHYDPLPHALLVRVTGPGRLAVYQDRFCMATLESGTLRATQDYAARFMDHFGVDDILKAGLRAIEEKVTVPAHEPPREWHNFQYLAYLNVIGGIVNAIQLARHGGALIVKKPTVDLVGGGKVLPKYRISDGRDTLQSRFITFMNCRHELEDAAWKTDPTVGQPPDDPAFARLHLALREADRKLAQSISFIGRFAGTDGAIVLNSDLTVEGFGAEIVLEQTRAIKAYQAPRGGSKKRGKSFDSEQKGMRHRSAIRLCGANADVSMFVVSQDGGASLVWSDRGHVFVRERVSTVNANMIFA